MHGGRAPSNRYYPFLSYIVASTRSRTASKKTSGFRRLLGWFFGLSAAALLCGVFLCVFVFSLIYRQLPPIDTLTDYRPKVPLRVWSADGKLIGEFGEERRDFVHLKDIPEHVKFAILAAEDDGFYEHHGVEITGILRAAVMNVLLGRRAQGGSTITQQVARNFFLTTDRTYTRKLYEIAMSFKIEQELTKDEILEIYLNQIYLGQRAYGFSSAARTYFGRPLSEISIGEAATLAGLPVAPSAYNPIVNPSRATMRKNYVLRRMYDLGYIDEVTYLAEKAQPMQTRRVASAEETLRDNVTSDRVSAKYAAELARMLVYDIFKDGRLRVFILREGFSYMDEDEIISKLSLLIEQQSGIKIEFADSLEWSDIDDNKEIGWMLGILLEAGCHFPFRMKKESPRQEPFTIPKTFDGRVYRIASPCMILCLPEKKDEAPMLFPSIRAFLDRFHGNGKEYHLSNIYAGYLPEQEDAQQ